MSLLDYFPFHVTILGDRLFPVSIYTIPTKSLFKVFMNILTSAQWGEREDCVECEKREKELLRKGLNN